MQIGDITALTEYAILILFYIIMAQMVIILLPRARVCIRRMEEVLETVPEIQDTEESADWPEEEGEEILRFENVGFCFSDAEENTLKTSVLPAEGEKLRRSLEVREAGNLL